MARRGYAGQVVHRERIEPNEASFGELAKPLPPLLMKRLQACGYLPLFSHQVKAVDFVREGANVMVATPSASGKTLCYHIPVLEEVSSNQRSRALYLYPTKALAQDQLRNLAELAFPEILQGTDFAIYDGDTPYAERGAIRKQARIILSNPDMLHISILPNHRTWAHFLRNLKYVVIDESHIYRGIFGSHVALVLRRLRRLLKIYGSNPQFITASATIANPGEHAENLVGLPFEVVNEDGSARGGRDFVFWNPPLVNKKWGKRRSANAETADLFSELVSQQIRTLVFTRTRRLTELIYLYARKKLMETGSGLAELISPYRAGYLPKLRRKIEQGLFRGELLGVVATTALELGIDVGTLEATVLNGYPGSIASAWQQAGRSGRSGGLALSFLVALDNPLDQYFMHHPESFFGQNFEQAIINPNNPYILRAHLLCAAWELPLSRYDVAFFGNSLSKQLALMTEEGIIRERLRRYFLAPSISSPAQQIGIRSISSEEYMVMDTASNMLLETVDGSVAFFQIYPGAIYLHHGETFLITKLDIINHVALAAAQDADYFTQTKELTDLRILNVRKQRNLGGINIYLGEVKVSTSVIGFKKMKQFTDDVIGDELLDLPPYQFTTVALWFDLPDDIEQQLIALDMDFAGGLHAVEHAAIGLLPLFALCDRNDIGGVSTPLHADTGRAQVFIYDAFPGGIGISERGFEVIGELWRATLVAVSECPCKDGCPSCIQSPKCGNNNQPLDKRAAVIMLARLTETLNIQSEV